MITNDLVGAVFQHRDKLGQVGKSILHTQFPDEFELYLIALELVSARDKTIMYFVFPIMPNNISESEKFGTNVIKTAGGIVTLSTSTFIPIPITLSGTFGRSLKYVIGKSYFDLVQGFSLKDLKTSLAKTEKALFDQNIKTGYGCCKILQDLLRESKVVDKEGPRTLYYHNLAFNSKYIVKPDDISFSQEVGSSNMIWNYRLSLTAVGLSSMFRVKKKRGLNTANVIQTAGKDLVGAFTKLLK